jgi:soluble lytic murein transglycosylase-like protein
MFNSTHYALLQDYWRRHGAEVWRDLVAGGLLCARSLVALVGCVTLLAGGMFAVSDEARGRLVEGAVHYSSVAPALIPEALIAAVAAARADDDEEQQGAAAVRKSAFVDDLAQAQESAALDPQQKKVASYLARRYRVADEAVKLIVAAAYDSGRALGLDPLLILAVTAIESSMNPFAQSGVGAQGLMQVMPRVHSERFEAHGGRIAALDPIINLKVGSEILKDYVDRGGSVERGLQMYVGAAALPGDGGYASRVLAELGRLKVAAGTRLSHRDGAA